jgi:hypothetical protein
MCLSIFLALVIGFYLFLVNLAALVHQHHFKKVRTELLADHPLTTLIASLSLLFGLFVVVAHNLWVASWPVLITLVGWVALLQGAASLLIPDHYNKTCKQFCAKVGHNSIAWVWLLVGLYLIWMGFDNSTMMMEQ